MPETGDRYTPQSLLVTGGAGFIGANFVHYWLQKYPLTRVTVIDALTCAGNKSSLGPVAGNPNFIFIHDNILNQERIEQILQQQDVDTIVHFAAESHVDRSIHDPDIFLQTNILGTHSLLKAARNIWLNKSPYKQHRFHHVSTDEVYGSLTKEAPAFTEQAQYAPNSPYAASKASSDFLVRAYHETYGLEVTTSNCSNNYGPYQFPEKLIPLMITHILNGQSLPVYGDGQQIRDWLHVDDHCRAVDLVIRNGRINETYHIGGDNQWTNIDIVELLCQLLDEAFAKDEGLSARFPKPAQFNGDTANRLIKFVKDRAGHDLRYAMNIAKISKELGYQPQQSFENGIRKTLQWYLDNEAWWQAVMNGSYQNWLKTNYGN